MIQVFVFFCLMFFPFSSLTAQEEGKMISLSGHLDQTIIKQAQVEARQVQEGQTLLLEVRSSSGDVNAVLEFAKLVYELRVSKGVKVQVYMNGTAIGPAAILPFLADELFASVFVSWGGISMEGAPQLPVNILRSKVRSLLSPNNPAHETLALIAEAMVDPSLKIVDRGGWKLDSSGKDKAHPVVSPEGETLVMDHHQLKDLQLVTALFPREDLKDYVAFSQDLVTPLQDELSLEQGLAAIPSDVRKRLEQAISYNKESKNLVGRIVIDDKKSGIDQSTWIYVRAALEHYKKTKPIFIILELNTPGGEVFSSQQISDALMDLDTNYGIPVVALIDNWAVSAGAMLAYSCRFIAIAKDATMGAAEPVLPSGDGGMQSASEKINSALRADFANRAGFFDRNPDIAQAMVDKDVILVLRNGKIVKLESKEQLQSSGVHPDRLITAEGKLLTLDAQAMMEYGVADFMLSPEKLPELNEKELQVGLWPAEKSLLFTHAFFKEIPQAQISTYQMDWKISFFALLASPAVSSMLFLGMMLGFYMEMNTPGFGFAGSIALACLSLIVLSSFSTQAVTWLELIIFLAGLALLSVEFFILPGFGVAGILGSLLILIGLFAMMLPQISSVAFDLETETFNAAGEVFMEKLAWLCGSLIVGALLIYLMARYVMPQFFLFNRLVLVGEESSTNGFVAGIDAKELPNVDDKGEVLATLRPSGKVLIEQEVYDAMSQGGFIEKGTKVRVVQVERSSIIVEEVTS